MRQQLKCKTFFVIAIFTLVAKQLTQYFSENNGTRTDFRAVREYFNTEQINNFLWNKTLKTLNMINQFLNNSN